MTFFRSAWKKFLFNRKYGTLRELAAYRLLTLYEALPEDSRRARFSGKVYEEERFRMDLLAENAAAWERILQRPGALRLALTCKKCGCAHAVICDRPLGRFRGGRTGLFSSELFELFRPGLVSGGRTRTLHCPRCGHRGRASQSLL
ncbi:MAG TPA: hypothetical protein VMU88_00370 [bacterium]|nr:hypothetical protein [bacterium]